MKKRFEHYFAITKRQRIGKSLFRKRSDKMRKELEDAAREGGSRRSNSPVSLPPLERTGSLSDLTGNAAKAAGYFSDGIPKNIHMKFVCRFARYFRSELIFVFCLGCP